MLKIVCLDSSEYDHNALERLATVSLFGAQANLSALAMHLVTHDEIVMHRSIHAHGLFTDRMIPSTGKLWTAITRW
jgi:hypothetical protein